MGKASALNVEQRREAVLALLRREESTELLARRYGVSVNSLYHWRDAFLEGGMAGLAHGQGRADPNARRVKELEHDLAERDRVIGELTIANRVLKKTAGASSPTPR